MFAVLHMLYIYLDRLFLPGVLKRSFSYSSRPRLVGGLPFPDPPLLALSVPRLFDEGDFLEGDPRFLPKSLREYCRPGCPSMNAYVHP